ncbi:hypothetical protein K490DRAFT_67825 [Saccharata proteae CBS 121410]|uniref:3-hydroxyisobutyrate dehydrogenase n=1 Tax=Saccharata proteae CBS 121410 TaxID=1314787 RepID=A0A9P4LVJ5_9PEZI|nr:hypothetical protein K490DRAFT_67825 [Saccharata proteae CBS 121410]
MSHSKSFETIGFIGLGTMGLPMAQNLASKTEESVRIYVYDTSPGAMEQLTRTRTRTSKITACSSSKEVASNAQTILSMVPEGTHARAVYLDPTRGVLAASKAAPSRLLIDCSTIDTAASRAIRDATSARDPNARFVDAPVSGGELGARNGTLTFMVGCAGDDAAFGRVAALLGLMGTAVFACGGPGLGLTAKLCNNYCSGLVAIATSEAFNVGMAAGMDPRVLAAVFHASTAQSAICDRWCPVPGVVEGVPSSDGYRGGFRVALMRKDFGLAVDLAARLGVRLMLGERGLETYTAAMLDPRCRDLDSRVVFRWLGGNEDWKRDFEGVD